MLFDKGLPNVNPGLIERRFWSLGVGDACSVLDGVRGAAKCDGPPFVFPGV